MTRLPDDQCALNGGRLAGRRAGAFTTLACIGLLAFRCSPGASTSQTHGAAFGVDEGGSGGGGSAAGSAGSGSSSGRAGADAATASGPQDAGSTEGSAAIGSGGVGEASAPCPAGTTLCGGACVDLTASTASCGTCGTSCAAGQVCQSGTCGCRAGQTTCSGACADTTSDAKNCGACGSACPPTMVCSQSKCASGCAGQLVACAGSCVDTSGSSVNCGSCGHACASDQTCWMGACECPIGQGACGTNGQCLDVMANTAHCGACSSACATGASCTAGKCSCPTGQTVCGGACVDLSTDAKNCGACGTACTTAGTQCLYGGCINPSSVDCGGGAMIGQSCAAYASASMGEYWVNNNEWGVTDGGTTGQQCIWGTCQTGDLVGWGTSWNWTAGNGQVKTYASLVFGWQWGWKVTNTGLPVQISAGRAVNCGWSFTVSQTGTLDVSYDTWLHAIANPGYADTPSEEVMIWLYYAGGAGPIGPTVASGVSLAGATWDLHQGPGSSWPVSSYVRTSNATTSVMNLMEFYKDLVSRGWIPNTRYLTGVQSGTEVFTGSGSLTTNGFYCRVQ